MTLKLKPQFMLKQSGSIFKILGLFSISLASIQAAPYTAIIMDPCSGAVIDGVDHHKIVYPASLTKMMTFYLIFDALERKRVSLDTLCVVSPFASRQPPCSWGLKAGQKISLRECILAMSVRSCNDVAVTVAENLAGSMSKFSRLMTETARALHMNQSWFYNPSGLHHPCHKSTAKDMALLLRALWVRFPQYSHFLRMVAVKRRNQVLKTLNRLQEKVVGMKMGKTGYTIPAGCNLATLVVQGQTPAIFVVMGMKSAAQRNAHMEKIIHAFYNDPKRLPQVLRAPLGQKKFSYRKL